MFKSIFAIYRNGYFILYFISYGERIKCYKRSNLMHNFGSSSSYIPCNKFVLRTNCPELIILTQTNTDYLLSLLRISQKNTQFEWHIQYNID